MVGHRVRGKVPGGGWHLSISPTTLPRLTLRVQARRKEKGCPYIYKCQMKIDREAILDALEHGLYEQAAQAIKTNWEESLKRVLSGTGS